MMNGSCLKATKSKLEYNKEGYSMLLLIISLLLDIKPSSIKQTTLCIRRTRICTCRRLRTIVFHVPFFEKKNEFCISFSLLQSDLS